MLLITQINERGANVLDNWVKKKRVTCYCSDTSISHALANATNFLISDTSLSIFSNPQSNASPPSTTVEANVVRYESKQ
jgi:hypothetical protein